MTELGSILDMASKIGVPGLCLLVMYFGWKREERMAKESDSRETRAAEAFAKLNSKQLEQSEKTVEILTALVHETKELREDVRSRPCVQSPPWNGADRRH